MFLIKKIISLFKKPQIKVDEKAVPLVLYSVIDYQEVNLENYLSSSCLGSVVLSVYSSVAFEKEGIRGT